MQPITDYNELPILNPMKSINQDEKFTSNLHNKIPNNEQRDPGYKDDYNCMIHKFLQNELNDLVRGLNLSKKYQSC